VYWFLEAAGGFQTLDDIKLSKIVCGTSFNNGRYIPVRNEIPYSEYILASLIANSEFVRSLWEKVPISWKFRNPAALISMSSELAAVTLSLEY
jgi:hypothetical protein